MPKLKFSERRPNPFDPLATVPRGLGPEMYRDVVLLFYATTGRLQRLRRLVASSIGLNSVEYSIVAALHRLDPRSGVRIRELADYLHMAPENVTTAVGRLVAAKWLVKAIDRNDGRAVTLRLRPVARRRMDRLTEALREVNELWFQHMSATEIETLIGSLGRVLNGFDAAYQKARETLRSPAHRRNE